MSTRLQVVVDEAELDAFRAMAARHGLTVSEWVRQTLRRAGREESAGDVEQRLAAVRSAARHAFPIGSIDELVAEIESGNATT